MPVAGLSAPLDTLDTRLGHLVEPVSLVADGTYLYVADRGASRIIAYDFFGGYVREYPARSDLVSVEAGDGELWVVLQDGIWIYASRGEFMLRVHFNLNERLVGAAQSGDFFVCCSPLKHSGE